MKKETKLTILSLLALILTSCTNSEVDGLQTPEQLRSKAENVVSFNTYMSGSGTTRAGATGAITTERLKDLVAGKPTNGFGVFAYYTGNDDYTNNCKLANFMYNQQVKWDNSLSDDYITKWVYDPLKYWPNEVTDKDGNKNVDDQDNDQSNNQTTSSGTYGGKVSFFAYAPYVSETDLSTGSEGIVKINNATTMAGNSSTTGNAAQKDPWLEYIVPADSKNMVDLLWGTHSGTSAGVTGAANAGVKGVTDAGGGTYAESILDGYTVNANLTKQKTTGTVGFAFKHALSKVGGSQNDPPGGTNPTNGLMIILDIDDLMGSETGGELEPITASMREAGKTEYMTKVTVSDVTIVGRSLVKNGNKKPGDDGYTPTYLTENKGTLNLATGQWTLTGSTVIGTVGQQAPTTAATTTHVIKPATSSGEVDGSAAASLSVAIAQPASMSSTANTLDYFKELPLGVTTTKQNVYGNEANPLVFIPGTWPELTVSITYTVRTYDENLCLAYSEVTQKVTKLITFKNAVKLNKQYSLLMHLGLTSVKFTATVSDWERTIVQNDEGTNDGEPVEVDAVEHIYIPRNVGEASPSDDHSTPAATITVGGVEYMITIKQEGIPEGGNYFDSDSDKPIVIKAWKKEGNTWKKVTLSKDTWADGPNAGKIKADVYVHCRASNLHFHRTGTSPEYQYNDGAVELRVQPADKGFCHAPIDVTLTIDGEQKNVSSTIYIYPHNRLPY